MDGPRLIEGSVNHYLQNTLRTCHEHRVKIYSFALNAGVLTLFILIVSFTLYYCYKQKPTPYEQQQKMLKDQQYILSKIRFYQAEQKNLMTSPIGNL
jgi:hypothetical protein